jgi:hypothetical protein
MTWRALSTRPYIREAWQRVALVVAVNPPGRKVVKLNAKKGSRT